MKNTDSAADSPKPIAAVGAYLVLQSAGRWSDVFRLAPPGQAVIGRSSAGQIVLRSEQASRQHARIYWHENHWTIEDMGSRNGTFVNGRRLQTPYSLCDGDEIQVAGFAIRFTRQIEGGPSRAAGQAGGAAANGGPTAPSVDEQLTMEMEPDAITDRRLQSKYLHETSFQDDRFGASSSLLKMAFDLARCESLIDSVETTLDHLCGRVSINVVGIYAWDVDGKAAQSESKSLASIPLVATRQSGNRSYRRPPESLFQSVTLEGGQAILARNICGDDQLAGQNSRGEFDVETLILAPVRDQQSVLRGLIHLTTTRDQKPLESDDLEFVVAVAEILAESLLTLSQRSSLDRTIRRSRKKIEHLRQQLGDKVRIVGTSEAIQNVVQQITLAAPTVATVLIRGESGVGKELVASALHHASGRRDGPLVCMNCAALSPSLLESELFGHEKGAFTGATDRKRGKFEMADGGTLMLDEIGEMSAEVQSKFLRVLEGHPFERVGGQDPIKVDVRVVAATNRDLKSMVREGKFRQDLYYRLHVIEILVPPLREREKDCLLLAEFFLDRFNREMGRRIEGFTTSAKKRLLQHNWPGNIRELKNVVERAVVLNTKHVIDEQDLLLSPDVLGSTVLTNPIDAPIEISLAELEERHIRRVLHHTAGNKSRAAAILGIERSTLDRKLKKFAADN